MSISTNIDGSIGGGANQLLDLLSLVSNPAVYEAKVKSLQATIAENQKYVEAVAPVSEILDLREKVKADKAASVTALAEAKVKADGIVKTAQDKADGIIADANAKATQLTSEAQAVADDAKWAQAEARKGANDVKKAKAEYDALSASLSGQQAQLAKAQADADAAKKEAEDLKADLIAKHTAFIKSL
jgi:cell division septum initiation protein DivIVA